MNKAPPTCPRCKRQTLVLIEVGTARLRYTLDGQGRCNYASDERFPTGKVYGACQNGECGHEWRLRKVTSPYEFGEETS